MLKTFILSNPRIWKMEVAVFILDENKKLTKRLLPFVTENVKSTQRREKGRSTHAQFTTADENLQEALYRSSGYGKAFYEKGDKEGKNKKDTLVIAKEDAELIALRSLYASAELAYDESDTLEVAKSKYNLHISALAGVKKLGESTATEIQHVQVDPLKQINDLVAAGKAKYLEEYGEEIPEVIATDRPKLLALIDGMNTPGFDVEAYVAEATKTPEGYPEPGNDEAPELTKEQLHEEYLKVTGTNVPNAKKSDLGWIKNKITEKKAESGQS